jgi:hypothetical protein
MRSLFVELTVLCTATMVPGRLGKLHPFSLGTGAVVLEMRSSADAHETVNLQSGQADPFSE